jgi:hypothetical protein
MPACFLVVRAIVSDPSQRAAFDDWYRREHLPQAIATFGAEKAFRFWSETDPSMHQAVYRFPDRDAAERAVDSAGMQWLIAEFDRVWPGIPRTRELLTLAEARAAG